MDQIRQGTTPQKMALSIALGASISVFPVLGSTTLLCFLFAAWLKLNHPMIQLVNYVLYPAQILMIPAFTRIGEFIFRAEPVPFSVTKALELFKSDQALFWHKYGWSAAYGISAWSLTAIPATAVIYFVMKPVLTKLAQNKWP